MQRKTRATAAPKFRFLQVHQQRLPTPGEHPGQGRIVCFKARELGGQQRRIQRGTDPVTIRVIALAGGQQDVQGRLALTGIIPAAVLKGIPLMTAAEATNVTDLLLGKVPRQIPVQFFLGARDQAGGTIANEDLLTCIARFQKVVEGNGAEGNRLPHQMMFRQGAHGRLRGRRARGSSRLDHAVEHIVFESLSERESAEISGHDAGSKNKGLLVHKATDGTFRHQTFSRRYRPARLGWMRGRHGLWRFLAVPGAAHFSGFRPRLCRPGRRRTGRNATGPDLFVRALWHGYRSIWPGLYGDGGRQSVTSSGTPQLAPTGGHRLASPPFSI